MAKGKNDGKSDNEDIGNSLKKLQDKMETLFGFMTRQEKRTEEIEKNMASILELRKEVDSLKAENRHIKDVLVSTQNQLRKYDQEKNKKKIEFVGVPKLENENLSSVITNICTKTGINIGDKDILDVYRRKDRFGGPGNVVMKSDIVSKCKELKLTTELLGFPGNSKNVYANTPLTPEVRQILYHAKQAMHSKGWKKVWIYGAEVYTKLETDGKPIKIESLENLNTLIQ